MTGGTGRSLEILDRFALFWDGLVVDVPPHSATLVAHLAVLDRPVHRSTVAGTLSPALTERRALGALRSALYRIHVPVVETDGDFLCLAAGIRVDLRDAIALARGLIHATQPPEQIEPALDVLGRDLMPNDDSIWIEAERHHFRHLRLSALDALAARLTDQKRFAEAVEAAQLAIKVEPVSESAEATLIRALVAEGNAAMARREYEEFRRRLWRDLHVRPTRGFDELLDAISSHVLVTAPSRDGGPAVTPR